MHIVSVNVGRPELLDHNGKAYTSAINKLAASGPVELTELGFVGDQVVNKKHHGGPLQAICVYPHEHYAHFGEKLGVELPVSSFGENLTTAGLLEDACCIGDVLRIGGATVAITKPREPCSTLTRKHGRPQLAEWIRESGYTGFYLRVIEAAPIAAGDAIELIERPHEGLTVTGAMHALFAAIDHEALDRYAACESLTPGWRERMRKRRVKEATGQHTPSRGALIA